MRGSPAIDKGLSFGLTTDARGEPRPYNNPAITNAPGGDGSDVGAYEHCCATVAPGWLTSVVSQKLHNGIPYGLLLPASEALGVESRTGGPGGNHMLVFNFAKPLTAVRSAAVTDGTGAMSSSTIGSDPRQYIVNLTGVPNEQMIYVTLSEVRDSAGNQDSLLTIPMGLLFGDSNGDRVVNSGDAQQTRNRSGQDTSATNFRSDFNLDGTINSGDATVARSRSGQFIP